MSAIHLQQQMPHDGATCCSGRLMATQHSSTHDGIMLALACAPTLSSCAEQALQSLLSKKLLPLLLLFFHGAIPERRRGQRELA